MILITIFDLITAIDGSQYYMDVYQKNFQTEILTKAVTIDRVS